MANRIFTAVALKVPEKNTASRKPPEKAFQPPCFRILAVFQETVNKIGNVMD